MEELDGGKGARWRERGAGWGEGDLRGTKRRLKCSVALFIHRFNRSLFVSVLFYRLINRFCEISIVDFVITVPFFPAL